MTIINNIALALDEDVHGANGDLTEQEIGERLISNIHDATNYAYADSGLVPVSTVARLLRSLWDYKDGECTALLREISAPRPSFGA
jgi:hypothetical protein